MNSYDELATLDNDVTKNKERSCFNDLPEKDRAGTLGDKFEVVHRCG